MWTVVPLSPESPGHFPPLCVAAVVQERELKRESPEHTADGHIVGGGGAEGSVNTPGPGSTCGFPDILIPDTSPQVEP